MAFIHKLAQRLARMKTALLMGIVMTIACGAPVADPWSAVTRLQVRVSPTATSLLALQTVQLTALVVDSVAGLTDRAVTWASSNSAIATVNGNGLVTGVSDGTATVTATSAGKNATAMVTVSSVAVASVSVSPAGVSLLALQTAQLTATPRDADGTALPGRVVTWGSGNTGVATVSGSGLVTGVGAGATVITATSEGRSVTAAITVTPTQVPVAWVGVSPASANLSTGQAVQLTATPVDASGNALVGRVVTWSSGNTNVATVNGNGLVTGVAAGSVTITAVSEGQDGSSAITVTPAQAPVAWVGVSPASANLNTGQTVQLTATPVDASGNPLVGRVVTWSSSSTNVATVNGNGLLTGVAAGSVTITAMSEGRDGSSAITVTPALAPVAWVGVSPASANLNTGQTVQLAATPRDAGGNALTGRVVTWSSSSTNVATVNANGLVTGVAAGSVTITATSESGSGTAAVGVTPTPPTPVASVTVSPTAPSVGAGQTVQLTATPWDASGNALTGRVVTWSSSSTNVATVNGNGLVTGVAAGSVTITATSEGESGSSAITVTAAAPPPPPPTGGMWPNEPAGWRSVTDYGFHDTIPIGGDLPIGPRPDTYLSIMTGWRVTNRAGLITSSTDATAPVSPSDVVRFFYPQGFEAGSEPGMIYYSQGGTKDHYVGYEFKLSNPYSNHSVGTKQWYPYGPTADYFMLFKSDSKMWLYVQADGSHGGAYDLPGNVNNPTITLGAWHRIEILQRYPTSSSSNDGIFRWWIDGVLCGNYTNVGWDTSSSYQELRFAPTWGGVGGSVSFDSYLQIDHVRISRP